MCMCEKYRSDVRETILYISKEPLSGFMVEEIRKVLRKGLRITLCTASIEVEMETLINLFRERGINTADFYVTFIVSCSLRVI